MDQTQKIYMARIEGELKNLSGTVGNMVFCRRNGVTYIRTKPSRYRDAKTDSQLLARDRFCGCNRFYSAQKTGIFKEIWKIIAKGTGKNAKNMFFKYNIHAFGKYQEITDYKRLHFSAGMLPLPDQLEIVRHNKRDCRVQWEFNLREAIGSPDDRLYIVELQTGFNTHIHETGIRRSECKAAFSTFDDITAHTRFYCFWGNEKCTSFSDTHYFKEIKQAEP